jgi:hypothetical protein
MMVFGVVGKADLFFKCRLNNINSYKNEIFLYWNNKHSDGDEWEIHRQ